MPAAVAHCRGAGEDEEMREVCLQALESFVARSAYDARPYVTEQIVPLALECLSHDPNYDDSGDYDDDRMSADDDGYADECVGRLTCIPYCFSGGGGAAAVAGAASAAAAAAAAV